MRRDACDEDSTKVTDLVLVVGRIRARVSAVRESKPGEELGGSECSSGFSSHGLAERPKGPVLATRDSFQGLAQPASSGRSLSM